MFFFNYSTGSTRSSFQPISTEYWILLETDYSDCRFYSIIRSTNQQEYWILLDNDYSDYWFYSIMFSTPQHRILDTTGY